jgi:hypothetical protein
MFFRQLKRSLFARFLLAVWLLQALVPVAVQADAPGPWVEICAASGSQWVKQDPGTNSSAHASADHCVLCAATGASPEFDLHRYLLPLAPSAHFLSKTFFFLPRFPLHSLRARGPPHFS